MTELLVPGLAEQPFRAHYRGLILGSLLRAAEAQGELYRAQGRSRSARRADRTAQRVRGLAGAPAPPTEASRWFGPRLRAATRIAWLATLALLLVDLAVFGLHSWATSVADLGLIVLTLVWFFVSVEDLEEPPPTQLTLFR